MAAIKEKRCYTAQEIQEILNISRPSVYNLIKKGEFHSVFVGGKHLISKKSFDDWLNGIEIGPVETDIAESNRNETTERDESYQMPNEKDIVKSADSASGTVTDSTMVNAGAKQETTEYQAMQEKFLQNLMNTYMMIKQTCK